MIIYSINSSFLNIRPGPDSVLFFRGTYIKPISSVNHHFIFIIIDNIAERLRIINVIKINENYKKNNIHEHNWPRK